MIFAYLSETSKLVKKNGSCHSISSYASLQARLQHHNAIISRFQSWSAVVQAGRYCHYYNYSGVPVVSSRFWSKWLVTTGFQQPFLVQNGWWQPGVSSHFLKFYMQPSSKGRKKFYLFNPGHMTKMAAIPIYVLAFKNRLPRTTGSIALKLGM